MDTTVLSEHRHCRRHGEVDPAFLVAGRGLWTAIAPDDPLRN